jgi:hypothetical protein
VGEDTEYELEGRSTEYLRGVQDCAYWVIALLEGELPEESRGWDMLDRLQEMDRLLLFDRFERDFGVRCTWEDKGKIRDGAALDKAAEKEA